MNEELLKIKHLSTSFYTEYGVVRAVDDVSIDLKKGETLGIVGESGSGKTVTAMSIMGLIENPGRIECGVITFQGEDLMKKTEKELTSIRGSRIGMVFQDSLSSLNPTLTVGEQISRVLRNHIDLKKNQLRKRVIELLELVGIPEPQYRMGSFPHEFSGGMRQRVLIAMAISINPALLILDEPTTALDVTIEAQIFELIDTLKYETNMGIILITHDLSVVANTCNRLAVMYSGKIIEQGSVKDVFTRQLHPYTRGLMRSIPRIEASTENLISIPGEVPDLIELPSGCNFTPRCTYAEEECNHIKPVLKLLYPDHSSACINALELAHAE